LVELGLHISGQASSISAMYKLTSTTMVSYK